MSVAFLDSAARTAINQVGDSVAVSGGCLRSAWVSCYSCLYRTTAGGWACYRESVAVARGSVAGQARQVYFCTTGPVVTPPRLLFTVIESTAGDTVNCPVYLPPPALDKIPMSAPVPAFQTVSVAVLLVLLASTFRLNERTVSSALVIFTLSSGART